jgi:uncharacterized damage-inducible protein DinB
MTWIAPEVTRPAEPYLGGEREMLLGWLEYQRATLLMKCAGLTGEQLALQTAPPSIMSLIGLVRHMVDVEYAWFQHYILRKPRTFTFREPDDIDFTGANAETAEADYALLIERFAESRAALDGVSLEDTIDEKWRGKMSVRWVLIHMIEEYARHNGHADLIRERIDGAVGD